MKLRKFHGTWSDTNFHRTLVPPNGESPSFTEFHGIPWNSGAAKWNVTQFQGIPFQMGAISKGRHFKWHKCSMEFHGNLVPPDEISISSMEFHGTLRLSFYSIPCYPGLLWIIHGITLTPYMVLPLFAIRFADYAGGIRVSYIQPSLF